MINLVLKFISLMLVVFIPAGYAESKRSSFEINEPNTEIINANEYLLGPGDILKLKFLGNPTLSGEANVMIDGKITAPQVGRVNLENLSLDEAEKLLESKYEDILIYNEIQLELLKTRPVNISIIGEVNNPGIYTISNTKEDSYSYFPRLVDALQASGGITENSDIKNIKIIRNLSGKNNQKIMATIDLSKLITDGDQSNNIYIYDQDSIQVPTIKNNSKFNLKKIKESPLFNKTIVIDVVGQVEEPGKKIVPKNTTLIQGILKAGGFVESNANKANIQILRKNKNGELTLLRYKVNFKDKVSESSNPELQNGDIVNIRRNKFTAARTSLGNITEPIRDLVNILGLYKIISD